jgi:general secretion pathway protein F
MLAIARFSRTLATLLRSGVPLLTSMDITKNVISNGVLSSVVENARDAIREGEHRRPSSARASSRHWCTT